MRPWGFDFVAMLRQNRRLSTSPAIRGIIAANCGSVVVCQAEQYFGDPFNGWWEYN
jgi:hypothetical protein